MKPRNGSALTPKTHFKGLSFMSYALRRSKASYRCVVWFGRSFDFTNMSLIYTSMVISPMMGRAISPMVSVVAPLNPDKIMPAELSLSSRTFICLTAGSCSKLATLPGSTSTLCTSKLLMHKISTSALWCGVMTLDGLIGGKDMGPSISCIAPMLSRVLMVFTRARTMVAHSSFFL